MTDHPLTESRAWDIYSDAHPVDAIRVAFDAGRKYERATNADQNWQEAEKLRTDIAESDAETLYERCERIREERDVFFRQCEYALDRAEKAEADLAEYMRAAADSRPVVDSQ